MIRDATLPTSGPSAAKPSPDCAANMRVSVFLGLYRVHRLGWTRDKAFDVMNSLWEPNEVWADFIERTLVALIPPR